MDIVKLIGIAFIVAIIVTLLRGSKPELSFLVGIVGILLLLAVLSDALGETIAAFSSIAQSAGIDNGLWKILLKIVGVGYVTEFGAGLLSDFGNASLADKIVLGGKITIAMLALPILQTLFDLLQGFLTLL